MTMAQTSYRVLAGGAHAMQPRLLDAWRAATAALARDDTEASAKRRCLVVAPHPDDETLGCGATIARKRAAGTAVLVAVVADGRYAQSRSTMISPSELASIRAAEAVAACARLGVDADDVVQLGHEDTHVAEAEQQVTEELQDLISRFRPEEVLVVCGLDHHPDHRAVHRATCAALRRGGADPVVHEFPVWSWIDGPWLDQRDRTAIGRALHLVRQPWGALRRGRASLVVTGPFAAAKDKAMAAHASQMSAYTSEPSWAVMDDAMLRAFRPDVEIFLPATPASQRWSACSRTT
jgi:LmbE family N-acetylglucosaminyl deacetylase